jgi:hypothetical protein
MFDIPRVTRIGTVFMPKSVGSGDDETIDDEVSLLGGR